MAVSFIAKDEPVSIKHMIHSRVAGTEKPRGYKRIHASDLTKPDYCPRMVRLQDVTERILRPEFIGTALRLTFDHGEQTNIAIAENWLVDAVVGDWKCLRCGHMHSFIKRPKRCYKCDAVELRYHEVRFKSKKTGASCGIDVLVDTGEPKLRIVEVKTIDKDMFKSKYGKEELLAPMAEHRLRTCLYMQIIADSDHKHKDRVNTNLATLLYKSKGFGCKDLSMREAGIKDAPFSPFKEFVIKRNDKLCARVYKLAKRVTKARKKEQMIERLPACSTAFCDTARVCEMVKACFSGKYPATMKEKK